MPDASGNFSSISAAGRDNAVADPLTDGRGGSVSDRSLEFQTPVAHAPGSPQPVRRMKQDPSHRPATWAVVLAFALIYVSWGTTFLAIREGVYNQHLPPALFGGTRV